MDPLLLALSFGLGGSVLLFVLGLSRAVLAQQIHVRARIEALDGAQLLAQGASSDVMRRARRFRLPGIERVTARFVGADAQRQLERAGFRLSVGDFVVIRLAAVMGGVTIAVVGAALAGVQGSPLVLAVLGGVAGILLPGVYLRRRIKRRGLQVERQLVELCEVMSTMLTSGFGYMQALSAAAEQVGRPLGDEVQRFMDAVRLGADFDVALRETRERLASPDFEVVATALEVQRRTGGNLAEILRGVGITIRERQAFQREILALTSRERFSTIIVAVFPLLLIGVLTLIMPEVFGMLFVDPIGHILLGIALGMDALGFIVAKRLAKLEA